MMNKHVLLIDDDPIFHVIFSRMINKVYAGLNVISFLNGKEALDYLNTSYSKNSQYVLLLDINMPVFNGWQFIEEIKKRAIIQNDNLTLYVVTSSTDSDDIKRAKSYLFVKDVLTKPLSVNTINFALGPLNN